MQGTTLGALLSARTGWLQARHGVLAQNIANADTPEFKPRDLIEPSFDDLLQTKAGGMGMARTHEDHIVAPVGTSGSPTSRSFEGYETAPAGNAVVLEEQAQLLGRTRLAYELSTGIYGKMVGLMRTAVGTGA